MEMGVKSEYVLQRMNLDTFELMANPRIAESLDYGPRVRSIF